jgi:hypothetical protein
MKHDMSISSQVFLYFRLGAALALSGATLQTAYSQERSHDFHEREVHGSGFREHEFHDHAFREHEYHERRFLDSRFHHDHYYPPSGFAFGALPPGYQVIYDPEGDLYFAEGVWYRQAESGRYVVVAPAIGVTVPVLPPNYATVMVRGVPYYYANNTYYMQSPTGYLVVDPPPSKEMVELPPGVSTGRPAPANSVIELPRN